MIIKLTPEQTKRCLQRLRDYVAAQGPWEEAARLRVADLRTVCVQCNVAGLGTVLRRQLDWSMVGCESKPDSTMILWEEQDLSTFYQRIMGLDVPLGDNYLMIMIRDVERLRPISVSCIHDGFVSVWDGDRQYYCVRSLRPSELLKLHICALNFARLADTPASAMIHGACVGVEGKGVLLCARGGRGKSTLTVTSLFKGFEYVSDDYLILKQRDGGKLTAFPIYSSTALTPEVYDKLYDCLGPSRFIGYNGRMNKYMLDISGWYDQVRWNYPVYACLFPEIAPVAEPTIIACTPQEKGRALTQIVHSSIEQTQQPGNTDAVRKLLGMLSNLPCYRIVLSPDLFRNVECLRTFIKEL